MRKKICRDLQRRDGRAFRDCDGKAMLQVGSKKKRYWGIQTEREPVQFRQMPVGRDLAEKGCESLGESLRTRKSNSPELEVKQIHTVLATWPLGSLKQ